ncbi:LamG-like jellyroll fold domain-containing protein [Streptomyces sp. NPDC058691]|uniref:LamG-like jellyroll fold domain-containing protein n=1 Tax=Streptomyces sp. NPDC058691 TaxID=3346601 RepID=UPI0036523367
MRTAGTASTARTARTTRTTRAARTLSAALALTAASLAGAGVATAPPAAALTPPVAMTADPLPTWQTNGVVWAMAQQGGTVFAGGTFSVIRSSGAGTTTQPAVNFAAFDAATGAPTGCRLSFTIGSGTATVRALEVSPDGRTLYAGGWFNAVNGVTVSSLAAIDIATCTPVASFRPSFSATVRALAVTDDTVYAGGDFTSVAGQSRPRFAALSTAGALRAWNPDADKPGRAIQLSPDGAHAVIGGDFDTVGGTGSHALAVVDTADGALTRAYPVGFIPPTSVVKDLTADATAVFTANEGTGGGVFDGRIALNTSDFGQRWRDDCLGATQSVVVYRTVLYSGSHAHDCSSMGAYPNQRRKHLLAESVDDPTLLPWFPDTNDGIGEGLGPRVMTVASSGGTDYLWVGGEFTTVAGAAQQGLTRFASGPDTGAPSVPEVNVSSVRAGEVAVRWRSALDLDDGPLTYRVYRNGSSTPVYTATGPSLPWSRPQLTFTDTSVTPGTTYSYRVSASDGTNTSAQSAAQSVTAAGSTQAYPARVVADGAGLYWRYEEASGQFGADSSPGDDNAVYLNGPLYRQTPGAVPGGGTAMGFNGSNDYAYSDARHPRPAAYSIETWFRTTTTSGGKLIGFGDRNVDDNLSANYDKHLYMANDGRLVFGVYNGGTRTVTTTGAYNDGAWHHVVATQGGDGMKLYVDGSPAGSGTTTTSQDYAGYWRIGGDNLSGWPLQPASAFFAGQLDETAVYPLVLTAAQVADHHTLGTGGGGTPPPQDTQVTVAAGEDTYVNAGAPSSNFGTSGSLAVRGSSAYVTYLRFALPSAPAGTVLKSATLRVRTNSDPTAGSADSQNVVPVTGAWTETGATYAGRPALSSTVLGTLSGATASQTTYTAALSATGLSGALSGSLDLALTSGGTDALWLWSSEAAGTGNHPELVLTFGAP